MSHSGAARPATRDIPNKIRCYLCHKVGHVAANCRSSSKEQEAAGNLGQKKDTEGSTRQRQVGSTDFSQRPKLDETRSVQPDDLDPMAVLYSSDSDGCSESQ